MLPTRRGLAMPLAALSVWTMTASVVFGAPEAPSRWLDRGVPTSDRHWLDEHAIGFAPPEMTDDLQWLNGQALEWSGLEGKVVVVQTFDVVTQAGRNALARVERLHARYGDQGVFFLGIHTPDGASGIRGFLERKPSEVRVALDPTGAFLDHLGAYKRPLNMLIDRNGVVQYAGLSSRGLDEAVEALIAEEHDPEVEAPARPEAQTVSAEYPPYGDTRISATDMRGRRGPAVEVQRWMGETPDLEGKVVLVDFWATWCVPCRVSFPHTAELQRTFPDDLVVVAVSDEAPNKVEGFMKSNDMPFAVAIDQQRRMSRFFGVRGIPHTAIMSADGVVRWQGHPGELTEETLGQIVEANRAATGAEGVVRYRWTSPPNS
ncbi:MAG: TlpA family protein disulfide reductase [Planctomycetota bacterium]|nr:TlpA family protein disulfide reductase [Planctomycetota bacterium]